MKQLFLPLGICALLLVGCTGQNTTSTEEENINKEVLIEEINSLEETSNEMEETSNEIEKTSTELDSLLNTL